MLGRRFNILKCFFSDASLASLQALEPCERVFAYWMRKAAVAGYPVAATQFHTLAMPVLRKIRGALDATMPACVHKELTSYWMYLFANYGAHFQREVQQNKKTPADLGLSLLTRHTLASAVPSLTDDELVYLLDSSSFPTTSVADSIEQSASNFHGPGVTTEAYRALPAAQRGKLNAYHELADDTDNGGKLVTRSYSAVDYCSEYLVECARCIREACEVARANPDHFDEHCVRSLDLLTRFLESGDEADFKAHQCEWLQMKCRVEYCFGLIEDYEDPMGAIGSFQADVTVKSTDMKALLQLLPSFERRFPFPEWQKRENMEKLPNAAGAHKIVGTGGYGPVLSTIAYCLPNYDDVRSRLGSKQVMYSLGAPTNLERYKAIYLGQRDRLFFDETSPDLALQADIASLTTTLHETIGHASGRNVTVDKLALTKLAQDEWSDIRDSSNIVARAEMVERNELVDGRLYAVLNPDGHSHIEHVVEVGREELVDGRLYAVLKPDGRIEHVSRASVRQVDISSDDKRELVGAKWNNGLEEMRAEVLALMTGMLYFDDLAAIGAFNQWPESVDQDRLKALMVQDIAGAGFRRWFNVPAGSTTVTQAHALADTGIMYYLVDNSDGAIRLVEEVVAHPDFPDSDYDDANDKVGLRTLRLDIDESRMNDIQALVVELATLVQDLSSTADGERVEAFMNEYAASTRNAEFSEIVLGMRDVCGQGVKGKLQIFPEFEPVFASDGDELEMDRAIGTIVDCEVCKPDCEVEACKKLFDEAAGASDLFGNNCALG